MGKSIRGFTNADVCRQLHPATSDTRTRRRHSQQTSRLLKLLHAHGLIARIPRSRRWRVPTDGGNIMATILHHDHYPNALTAQAA